MGYAIIIADELHLCLSQLLQMRVTSDFYFLFSREFVLIVVTLFIILPIALQKKITALRYTSFFAIIGILYITIVVVHTHQRSNVDDVPRVYHPLLRSGRGCELRLRPCPLLDRGQRDEGELHWFR